MRIKFTAQLEASNSSPNPPAAPTGAARKLRRTLVIVTGSLLVWILNHQPDWLARVVEAMSRL